MKLEFIVMEIDLKRIKNDKKSIKVLYLEAKELLKVQTFEDKRLSGIINEEGGKIDLRQKEYDKALEKFTLSFHNYKDCGDSNAINSLKYSILSSLMARNKTIIVSTEEAKKYGNDQNLINLVNLFKAYENMDINKINNIWNSEIVKKENDLFIKENMNEIIYNIRLNYITNKLKAYKICKIERLSKELNINKKDIIAMILQIGRNKYLDVKINFVQDYIEIEQKSSDNNQEENLFTDVVENYNLWLNLFA
jgi:COP9 signalosome complex subunit 2